MSKSAFWAAFLCLFCIVETSAQEKENLTTIKGRVLDASTSESVIGAAVTYAPGKGTTADIDGNFTLKVPPGNYEVTASFVGFKAVTIKANTTNRNSVELEFRLKGATLREVEVVGDIAIARETPVAFSNVDPIKIKEQIGSQDLPMVMNSTPGVYATQRGGGDGDARISIRGFDSRNVGVLIDGIPMNDMANGRVFWNNWVSIENNTGGVQIQRGLGASKLAIPSIGGTMNITTASTSEERKLAVRQEYGNNFNYRSGVFYNSGRLKKGWSFSAAGVFRRNDGYVDMLYSRVFSYYTKVEKRTKKHVYSFMAIGTPQISGQRNFAVDVPVYTYSKNLASQLGIDTTGRVERGVRYNQSWGYLARTRDGDGLQDSSRFNTNVNIYHKPVISVKDFWQINEKFHLSTIVYASWGLGGGTELVGNVPVYNTPDYAQLNLQVAYNANSNNIYNGFGPDSLYKGQRRSTSYVRLNRNDHSWYGALSTFNYKLNSNWNFSGGIDARTYQGRVYSTFRDMLGGDLVLSTFDANEATNTPKFVGDVTRQNIERLIRWFGAFGLAEYKAGNWSAFFNASTAFSFYKQYNYFLKRQLVLPDTTLLIGHFDQITYQGTTYDRNSEGLRDNQTDWKMLPGFTFKTGANYNLTERSNVFVNAGYLNRAPLITFVFRPDNQEFRSINNEKIYSAELGYSYRSQVISFNVNTYYTIWDNRPTTVVFNTPDGPVSTNASGMSALHKGFEFDGAWKINKKFTLEGMFSLGDWKWNSIAVATLFDNNGNVAGETRFDPSGLKVGDAAQHTYALSLRFEPIRKLYIKGQYNFFSRNYANFVPDNYIEVLANGTVNNNLGRQTWRMPDYGMFDLFAGYSFNYKKTKIDLRTTINNVLNTVAITDAQDNQFGSSNLFNASAAAVNALMGTRWLTSLNVTF